MGPRELTYSFSVVLYGSTGVSNEIPELYGKASWLQVKPLCLQIELLWLQDEQGVGFKMLKFSLNELFFFCFVLRSYVERLKKTRKLTL